MLESNYLLEPYTAKKEAILATYDIVKPYFEDIYSKKRPRKRFVDFNQGIDSRLITDENMEKLFEIPIRPVRIAFDHWELHDVYEESDIKVCQTMFYIILRISQMSYISG